MWKTYVLRVFGCSILALLVNGYCGDMTPFDFPEQPTCMAVSDTGTTVIFGFEKANKIRILDTASKEVKKELNCPSPRHMIVRNNTLWIANYGHGTVTEVALGSLSISQSYSIPNKTVYLLSAAHGDHFKGDILINSEGNKDNIHLLNSQKKTVKPVPIKALGSFGAVHLDYQGKRAIIQSPHNYSPRMLVKQVLSFPSMQPVPNLPRTLCPHTSMPLLSQYRPKGYWFGENKIFIGLPLSQMPNQPQLCVVQDIAADRFFRVDEDKITLHLLNMAQTTVGEWAVKRLQPKQKKPGLRRRTKTWTKFSGVDNLAVVRDGVAHLFFHNPDEKIFYYCDLDMAKVAKEAPPFNLVDTEARALPLNHMSNHQILSENGKYLFLLSPGQNAVTVWDILAEKTVAVLETAHPVSAFDRKGALYLANGGDAGTISVFSMSNWALTNQLLAGGKDLRLISAIGGAKFDNALLASCATKRGPQLYHVDCVKDNARLVNEKGSTRDKFAISYDGSVVFFHTSDTRTLPTRDLLGPKGKNLYQGTRLLERDAYEIGAGSYMYNLREVYSKTQPAPVYKVKDRNAFIVADPSQSQFYEFDKNKLKVMRLGSIIKETSNRDFTLPSQFLNRYQYQDGNRGQLANIAVTHDDVTYIFLADCHGLVYGIKIGLKPAEDAKPAPPVDYTKTFVPLPFDHPPTAIEPTADGKYLLIAHCYGNTISVWDIGAAKVTRKVACPLPMQLLSRAGKFIVRHGNDTAISVYSASDWSLEQRITIPNFSDVQYLSAPGETCFDNTILVTVKNPKQQRGSTVVEVNIKTGKQSVFTDDHEVDRFVCSYNGKHLVGQHSSSFSLYSRKPFSYLRYGSTRGRGPLYLTQVHDGKFWFTNSDLFGGTSPVSIGKGLGNFIFPDIKRKTFFTLTKNTLQQRELNADFTPTLKYELPNVPPETRNSSSALGFHPSNIAISSVNRTNLFALTLVSPYLYLCQVPVLAENVDKTVTQGPVDAMPENVQCGAMVQLRLHGKLMKGTYLVMQGPKTMTVTDDGLLKWTPAQEEVGVQTIKIRSTIDKKVAFLRYRVNVVPAPKKPTATPPKSTGKFPIFNASFSLQPGADGKSLLLYEDGDLKVLDADGMTVVKTVKLKAAYNMIFDRNDYYVCLGTKTLDLVSKAQQTVFKSISIPGEGALCLALHPGDRVAYVTSKIADKDKDGIGLNRILIVDELAGTVKLTELGYGQNLAMDPSGRHLFAQIHEMYENGYDFHYQIGYTPSFGHIDLLISYDLYSDGLGEGTINKTPGKNGRGIVASPDGRFISHVSGGGLRVGPSRLCGYTVPAFGCNDITKPVTSFKTGAYPVAMAYHPMLDMVIASNEKAISFYKVSGEARPEMASLPNELASILRLGFSPSGKNLLLTYKQKSGLTLLEAIPLKMSPLELAVVNKGYQAPKVQPLAKRPILASTPTGASGKNETALKILQTVDAASLDGLGAALSSKLSPSKIAKTYMDSVVIIKDKDSSGTGFFISKNGYVLTCAHVLTENPRPTITYKVKRRNISATATVVAIDRNRDLAMLKIKPLGKVNATCLPKTISSSTGEDVCIIGHPGLGSQILDYTMTNGIISNPNRIIDNTPFIQTNASVNPGVSGGPMFDKFGNVIGVVVLKASLEGVALAVPHKDIIAFIKKLEKK